MLLTLYSIIYAIIVWFAPSAFWHFRSNWFKSMAKRFKYFLLAFSLSIFILCVIIPILVVAVIEGKDLRFMGFFFPSLPDLLLFTLAPYTILLAFSLLESWYRVTRKFESLDIVAPLPRSYPREVLDQVLSVAFPEEVLHRGYLLPHLLELLNSTFAIGVSAIIFSCLHILSGGRYRALRTIVDGVILGTAFMYAGLLPCMLVHFAGNLFTGKVERTILGRTQR